MNKENWTPSFDSCATVTGVNMRSQDMRKLEEFFHAALELGGEDRRRFVAESCRDRPDLREQLEKLLAAAESPQAAVDAPAIKPGAVLDDPLPGPIGPYRILEVLGEGGMGTVYLAEQTHPVKRRVALKLIKLGMDTKQVVARFESERQALAMMNHPNVASVYDAGATEQGRPYFVMEYVPGEPITTYCDKHQLSLPDRLQLFMQVCQAIQHAHQKGIIHRDIKPSNILVTNQDGKPVPKVIDFGVAKATDQRLTEKTIFTEQGLLIGTPAYMSPEQAAGGPDIDTRTDVYSLGVLLYELLTGTLPFDPKSLRDAGFAAIQRIIREVAPPRPSARLSSMAHDATVAAKLRGTNSRTLARGIQGDLDSITMKALEKAADRRYSTPLELAEDLKRFLAHQPVSASPPFLGYRIRCFLRRNGTSVAAALLATVVVAMGVTFGVTASIRASREQALSEQSTKASEYRGYLRSIGDANHALDYSFPGSAERLLAVCPPHLRGWEWEHLNAATAQRDLKLVAEPEKRFGYGVRVINDGRQLLTTHWTRQPGGISTVVRVFDLFSGALVQRFTVEGGVHLPSGVEDHGRVLEQAMGRVRVWDAAKGAALIEVVDPTLTPYIYRLPHPIASKGSALSGDGTRLAILTSDGAIEILNVDTGNIDIKIDPQPAEVDSVWFSPAEHVVLTTSDGSGFQLWDTDSGQRLASFDQEYERALQPQSHRQVNKSDVHWSADGRFIVTTRPGCHVWDWKEGRKVCSLKDKYAMWEQKGKPFMQPNVRGRPITDPTSRWLAIAERGGEVVHIYDLESGRLHDVLKSNASDMTPDRFSPDGRLLVTTEGDRTIKIWDVESQRLVRTVTSEERPYGIDFTPCLRFLVAGTPWDIRLWPLHRIESAWEPPTPDSTPITTFAISACGEFVVVKRAGGRWCWKVGSSTPPRWVKSGASPQDISSGGHFVLCNDRDDLVLWATEPPHSTVRLKGHEKRIIKSRFSPAGDRFASASWDKTARVWSVDSLTELHVLRGHTDHVYDVVFSPDGRMLATASRDGTARIWDASTGACLIIFDGHRQDGGGGNMLRTVAFSPDGTRVASSSHAGIIRIWKASNGEQIFELRGHAGSINSALFSPDGLRIASGSTDGTIRIWDSATGEALLTKNFGMRAAPACVWSPDGKQVLVYTKTLVDRVSGLTVLDTEPLLVRYREKVLSSEAGRRAAKIVTRARLQGSSWLETVSDSYEDGALPPDVGMAIRELVLLGSSAERHAEVDGTSQPNP